ncbi:MAG: serine--tRNA ligase [Candidatus Micrarchaeota archaeon]
MLDIKLIRKNPEIVESDLKKRGDKEKLGWLSDLVAKDVEYRQFLAEVEQLRSRRNRISMEIGEAKKSGKDASQLFKEAKDIPQKIKSSEEKMSAVKQKVDFYLMRLPNILHESVPVGASDEENAVVRVVGKKTALKKIRDHVDLLAMHGQDLERAATISGARFYFLKGDFVLLDMALQRLAMDMLVKRKFTPVLPPMLMHRKPYEGVTDLADFESVMYKVEGEDLYLIATSEHPLVSMHGGEIFEADALPLRYAGVSSCFRKEAGAHGKDTKGIFRVHQFNKVEQVVFSLPEESWKIHEELLKNSEDFFKLLKIPYRVVNVCTGDIGIVAAKKYDIEAWMPSQEKYRELGSCSNCTTYQANRLGIRYRLKKGSEEKEPLHTLNNTMVATARTIAVMLENFQKPDGAIKVPTALQKYMNNKKELLPNKLQ